MGSVDVLRNRAEEYLEKARAIGSLHQALISGVLVQLLIDPERAPSPADLAQAMAAIAAQIGAEADPAQD